MSFIWIVWSTLCVYLWSEDETRVSNGTGFSCPAGQSDWYPLILPGQRRQWDKDCFCPGTKGQQDKLKTLPWDGTGQSFSRLSRSIPGCPAGQNRLLSYLLMLFLMPNVTTEGVFFTRILPRTKIRGFFLKILFDLFSHHRV